MKDKLLYLTIGLLIGVVVMQWGVTRNTVVMTEARAGYVDHNTFGIIALNGNYLLDEFGRIWVPDSDAWQLSPHIPLPAPVEQVKFWEGSGTLVTTDNILYTIQSGPSGNWWVNHGPWPGGQPVPTDNSSWGSIKNKLEGND